MEVLMAYLDAIQVKEQRDRMEEVFQWIVSHYPQLEVQIKWKQPMFVDHGTFIIGFSMAKNHLSFTPEEDVVTIFKEEIEQSGYEHTKGIIKVKWSETVDYTLLKRMIDFNITDKAECKTFFRK